MEKKKISVVFYPSPESNPENPYLALYKKYLKNEEVQVVEHGRSLSLSYLWKMQGKVSILHFHWPSGFYRASSLFCNVKAFIKYHIFLVLAKALGYKVFWTVHNLYPHELRFKRLHTIARRSIAKIASGLFVHCKGAEELVTKTYGVRDKFYQAPYGDYLDVYVSPHGREVSRKILGLKDGYIFVTLGMLRKYKGIVQAAENFLHLAPMEAQLVIAGPAGNKDEMEKLREIVEKSNGRIKLFMQFISAIEIPIFMGAADCVWLTYKRIFTSGALVMALSQGKPVLAPDFPFIREMLTPEAGVIYKNNDEKSLAEGFKQIMAMDPEKAKQEALRIAREKCSWEKLAKITTQAYRKALSKQ